MFGEFDVHPDRRTPLKTRMGIPERYDPFMQQAICSYDDGMAEAWFIGSLNA